MNVDFTEEINSLNQAYTQLFDDELTDYRTTLAALEKVYNLLPDAPERPLTFPAIMGRSYDENFISDYLAYILDPARNGLGTEPLEVLLNLVGFDTSTLEFNSIKITREHTFANGGRIDFLIEIDDSLVMGIENKIFSAEGGKQTISYAKSIKQEFKDVDRVLIFLTPAPAKQRPSSKDFHAVSYRELYFTLRGIQYPWMQDVRRSFFWEDFLTHLEVYITMNKGLPDVSEKTKLYLENVKVISDLQTAFNSDSQRMYDYLTTKIVSGYEGGDWDQQKQQNYQRMRKHAWKTDELRIIFVFMFLKEILRADHLECRLQVLGYGKEWNTSLHIDSFIELLVSLNPDVLDEIKAREMQYRPGDRPWAIARKIYELKPDPEFIDQQFSRAVDEFSFLIAPVDRTLAEYQGLK